MRRDVRPQKLFYLFIFYFFIFIFLSTPMFVAWLTQFCDGVGIARLLNATLVLSKFELAAYWDEQR